MCNKQIISANGVRKPVSFEVRASLFIGHTGLCVAPELPQSAKSTDGGWMEATGSPPSSLLFASACAAMEVEVFPHYIVVYRILLHPSYHWLPSPRCHDSVHAHHLQYFIFSYLKICGGCFPFLTPDLTLPCSFMSILNPKTNLNAAFYQH